MRVALIHDQLQEFGGAERVLISLHNIFPDADVYTSFYDPKSLGKHFEHFKDWKIITSWMDKLPLVKKLYSPLRFITPYIWQSFDLSNYDLVISSSGSYMCKGVITKPSTLHLCYLHHPPRYLYYYQTAREWQKYWPIRAYGNFINHDLRVYDYISSQRVNYFIANSEETKKRIEKYYRRDAEVIYPPVSISNIKNKILNIKNKNTSYYITVARLEKTKHIDVLIRSANKKQFNLVIVGTGRDEERLKLIAGKTVTFTGSIDDKKLHEVYTGAKAFLFAATDEEFGIVTIEAMSYGLPVIAFKSGGLKETVKEGFNGYLYNELNEESIIKKIELFEKLTPDEYIKMKENARNESEKYSEEEFKKKILNIIKKYRKIK